MRLAYAMLLADLGLVESATKYFTQISSLVKGLSFSIFYLFLHLSNVVYTLP